MTERIDEKDSLVDLELRRRDVLGGRRRNDAYRTMRWIGLRLDPAGDDVGRSGRRMHVAHRAAFELYLALFAIDERSAAPFSGAVRDREQNVLDRCTQWLANRERRKAHLSRTPFATEFQQNLAGGIFADGCLLYT